VKSILKTVALLLALASLFSLCSCGLVSSIIESVSDPSGTKSTEVFYTATYDLNYDGQKNIVSFASSQGYTPQPPARPGYRFLYWSLNDVPTDGAIPAGYTGDITLVAVWEIVTYRFIYENLTEEEFESMPQSFTVQDNIEIPNPTRFGYRFLGWNTELQTDLIVPAGQTGDYILHANWVSLSVNSFTVSANVESIPISTSYSDQALKIGSLIRASAPVYQNDYRFVHWEINGKAVCDTPIYTFPLSLTDTNLQAIYEEQTVLEWTPTENTDLTVSDLLSEKPDQILGSGIKTGDYTFTETGITFKATYLTALEPGDHSFYLAAHSETGEPKENRTFLLRLIGKSPEKPGYEGLPETGKIYLSKTVSFCGEQLPLVASTNEEFCKLVQYSVLVGGVLQLQSEGKTTGEYRLNIYIWGDLNRRLQAGEKILATATSSVSFPMNPKVSISYSENDVGAATTVTVVYSKGLNALKSSIIATPMTDRQGLLTSPGRTEDFEAFPIDALTEVVNVQTIYELEVLPFGKKPIFAETANDAEQIYQTARGILREIVDNGMSDYEKAKAIYSWIALNLTYDTETEADPNRMTSTSYTLKGALIDRLAVCDGYASAFRLFCQIEGIRAEEVIGLKQIDEPASGHAWNKIWIGGAVFGVDCTWARQKMDDYEIVTTGYLFLDEPELIACGHYENAAAGDFWVNDLANASILLPAGVSFDALNHSFVINSLSDLNAMIAYLKLKGFRAAEFYLPDGAPAIYSTEEYTAYQSGRYGYLFLKE